jgi:hypothetical protein
VKRGSKFYSVALSEFCAGVLRADVYRSGKLAASFACVEGEEPEILAVLRQHFEGPRLRVVKGGAS